MMAKYSGCTHHAKEGGKAVRGHEGALKQNQLILERVSCY